MSYMEISDVSSMHDDAKLMLMLSLVTKEKARDS